MCAVHWTINNESVPKRKKKKKKTTRRHVAMYSLKLVSITGTLKKLAEMLLTKTVI